MRLWSWHSSCLSHRGIPSQNELPCSSEHYSKQWCAELAHTCLWKPVIKYSGILWAGFLVAWNQLWWDYFIMQISEPYKLGLPTVTILRAKILAYISSACHGMFWHNYTEKSWISLTMWHAVSLCVYLYIYIDIYSGSVWCCPLGQPLLILQTPSLWKTNQTALGTQPQVGTKTA